MLQGGVGDINEMSCLRGRGDSDPAKKICGFQQELDEPKDPSQPLETSWAKALHEPRAETPLGRTTGRKWSRMKENPF